MYYIYILTNKYNKVLYVGVTNNVERRQLEHISGLGSEFTHRYNAHKLVYYEAFNDPKQAIAREKQLKGWRRDKKETLINAMNPEWKDLSSQSSP